MGRGVSYGISGPLLSPTVFSPVREKFASGLRGSAVTQSDRWDGEVKESFVDYMMLEGVLGVRNSPDQEGKKSL